MKLKKCIEHYCYLKGLTKTQVEKIMSNEYFKEKNLHEDIKTGMSQEFTNKLNEMINESKIL